MKKLAIAGLVVCALASSGLHASAFINGGFESPVLAVSPDFVTVPTGWNKVDPFGGLFMQAYSSFGLPLAGGEGNQAFGFGGLGDGSGNLSQIFDTTPGATYLVSFQYVIQQGLEFEDLLAEALNGAAVLGSQAIRFSNTAWVVSNFNFVAAGASTTLRFSDTTGAVDPGLGGGTNWALDAVSVVQTGGPPGVPEPASLAPVALVLAALAARRRARNSD